MVNPWRVLSEAKAHNKKREFSVFLYKKRHPCWQQGYQKNEVDYNLLKGKIVYHKNTVMMLGCQDKIPVVIAPFPPIMVNPWRVLSEATAHKKEVVYHTTSSK